MASSASDAQKQQIEKTKLDPLSSEDFKNLMDVNVKLSHFNKEVAKMNRAKLFIELQLGIVRLAASGKLDEKTKITIPADQTNKEDIDAFVREYKDAIELEYIGEDKAFDNGDGKKIHVYQYSIKAW